MPFTDFTCLLFVLATQRVYQQNWDKITFKLLRKFTSVPIFNISVTVTLVMVIIENICKSKVLFSFSRRTFIKTAPAIQYKSGYKPRSVVAPMDTRTYKSAILKTIFGPHFWLEGNGHPQSSYIEVSGWASIKETKFGFQVSFQSLNNSLITYQMTADY